MLKQSESSLMLCTVSHVTMTTSKETIKHAMFIDKIAFAYSVILRHVMMHMKDDFLLSVHMYLYFDLTLHCIVLHGSKNIFCI